MHLKITIFVFIGCLFGIVSVEGASQLSSISTMFVKAVSGVLATEYGNIRTSAHNSKDSSQKWLVMYDKARNVYEFINVSTGRLLDSNAAGQCYMHEYNDGDYQKWRISATGAII